MKLTLALNEQNRCCPCLLWIPICIFKESHCQGLSSAMSWIVYAWKITNQMFCSLWWSSAIIFFFSFFFFLPFSQYKAFLNPRLDCGRIISRKQFFFEHPQHSVPDSVLLIMFLLYSRLISLCSRFHMSLTQGGALKEQEHFSTFGIFYFRSAAESQGFSGEGMCKHFLE